ncbi:MAG: DoxX family protein [Haloferacaceae archaeon]
MSRPTRLVLAALGCAVLARPAVAHVDYVTEGSNPTTAGELFAAVAGDPTSLLLLAGGAAAGVVGVAAYLRYGSPIPDVEVARRTLASYRPYLPWLLRLAMGLPLVGAGFAGYYFSPTVPAEARLLQVGIGFLLLFGLATRPAALAGVVAWVAGVATYGSPMLLSGEYVPGLLAVFLVGPGQPSADSLFRRLAVTDGTYASRLQGLPSPEWVLARVGLGRTLAPTVVRVGLGLNFAYLGVTQKLLAPGPALQVVEKYGLTNVVPVAPELWVVGAGVTELAVGLLLILGAFTRGSAAVGFLLLTTTLFGLPDDPVLAHVTLFGLTSALLVTGSGPYALDQSVVPALRDRLRPADAERVDRTPAGD